MLDTAFVCDFPMVLNAKGQVREALLDAVAFESRGEGYIIALLRDVTHDRKAARGIEVDRYAFGLGDSGA